MTVGGLFAFLALSECSERSSGMTRSRERDGQVSFEGA